MTGTENYGGPVVTAGGVLFIGASADETFRAFDRETGETLWEAEPSLQRQRHAKHLHGRRESNTWSSPRVEVRPTAPLEDRWVAFALPDS